jgi:hypothetical protein
MNCERVEPLLPLHAGGDLDDRQARAVAEHLLECARCAGLAEEHRASLERLLRYGPPELADEFYGEIRRSVLGEIARGPRPSVLARLSDLLFRERRLALAAASVLLVSCAALAVATMGERRTGPAVWGGGEINAKAEPPAPPAPAPLRGDPGPPDVVRVRHEPRAPKAVRPSRVRRSPDVVAGSDTADRPVQRIEIQTRDQNIRIIWFAPRDTGATGATES